MKTIYDKYLEKCETRALNNVANPNLTDVEVEAFFKILEDDSFSKDIIEKVTFLIKKQTPSGVDNAAKVKADKLFLIASGTLKVASISPANAVEMLGDMVGGFCVDKLIQLLDHPELASIAAEKLKTLTLVYEKADLVLKKSEGGNLHAQQVVQAWADAEWFTSRNEVAECITMTVFKVVGESNTDDISPAQDAWSRPDIPLHALSMYKMRREGVVPDKEGEIGPIRQIETLKEKGHQICFVGDVVGTGSSRKSATNSLLWFIGEDIPNVPNKRGGGVVIGGKIAPIFFNTLEDSGALPIEADVSKLQTGDTIDIYPYLGIIKRSGTEEVLSQFELKHERILDQVRAGGRIPYLIGRALTDKVRSFQKLPQLTFFKESVNNNQKDGPFTLAQKIVGKACGKPGVAAGEFCIPTITTVGSQDTTGGMTRDEIKELACTKFNASLVMQSFCHTAPYPRVVDSELHAELPSFFETRGGVALRPGDGVIHSWLNRMLLPDTVGTGGDSHTRFPVGISFPAGSGLVAYAAATGTMPLDMPESVLVKFKGEMQPGITLRDLVHSIPYFAKKNGLLTISKENKTNVFSGRILEIQGLEHLTVEQAFELTDASAERSASGATITLSEENVVSYMKSNVALLEWMIANGYGNSETIKNRIDSINEWLAEPCLMKADDGASYAATLEIDLSEIKEPILCCPNDPDDAQILSEIPETKIDEVFIGSCMTNIGHFRAAARLLEDKGDVTESKLWLAPPTKMDDEQLRKEGCHNTFVRSGARIEMPGCSLCMGNQARVAANTTVISTSTRNFPNRLGQNTQVFLSSAELAAVSAGLGRMPSVAEYQQAMKILNNDYESTYQYLSFDKEPRYCVKNCNK